MAFIDLVLGALVVFVATSIGAAAIFLLRRGTARTVMRYPNLMAFCAGVMAFTAMEMFRESQMDAGIATAIGSALVGIFLLFVFEKCLPHLHFALSGRKRMSLSRKKAALIAGAIAIHNIPEGFSVASAFTHSVPMGWLVTLSIALQDVPEGLLIAAPLICYGISSRRSFQFGAFSGFIEGATAVVSYGLLSQLIPMVPGALALSAGAMACVIVKELLPDAFRMGGQRKAAALAFAGGIAIAFALASTVFGF